MRTLLKIQVNIREMDKIGFLYGFKQRSDSELRVFKHYPDIADYFTVPADFIYDKSMELSIDYDHIINDNYERFVSVGLTDQVEIKDIIRRNYLNHILTKMVRVWLRYR